MIRVPVAAAGFVLLAVGCGGGNGGGQAGPTPCPLPNPGGDPSLLPKELRLAEYGVVTDAEVKRGFLSAQIVSETAIVELYPPIARSLLDNGYEILSGDNEGFEAEIIFRKGKGVTGNLYMLQGPCKDQVTMTFALGGARENGKANR